MSRAQKHRNRNMRIIPPSRSAPLLHDSTTLPSPVQRPRARASIDATTLSQPRYLPPQHPQPSPRSYARSRLLPTAIPSPPSTQSTPRSRRFGFMTSPNVSFSTPTETPIVPSRIHDSDLVTDTSSPLIRSPESDIYTYSDASASVCYYKESDLDLDFPEPPPLLMRRVKSSPLLSGNATLSIDVRPGGEGSPANMAVITPKNRDAYSRYSSPQQQQTISQAKPRHPPLHLASHVQSRLPTTESQVQAVLDGETLLRFGIGLDDPSVQRWMHERDVSYNKKHDNKNEDNISLMLQSIQEHGSRQSRMVTSSRRVSEGALGTIGPRKKGTEKASFDGRAQHKSRLRSMGSHGDILSSFTASRPPFGPPPPPAPAASREASFPRIIRKMTSVRAGLCQSFQDPSPTRQQQKQLGTPKSTLAFTASHAAQTDYGRKSAEMRRPCHSPPHLPSIFHRRNKTTDAAHISGYTAIAAGKTSPPWSSRPAPNKHDLSRSYIDITPEKSSGGQYRSGGSREGKKQNSFMRVSQSFFKGWAKGFKKGE